MDLTSPTYTLRDKIKTPFAKMIVSGSKEKPVYEIMYIGPNDMQLHVGYASYNVKFVFQWLEECFDIDEYSDCSLAIVKGLDEDTCDLISKKDAQNCVNNEDDWYRINHLPGVKIIPIDGHHSNIIDSLLKPCPICGGRVEIVGVNNDNPFHIWCEQCGLEFGVDKDYLTYQLIEAWNKRAGE